MALLEIQQKPRSRGGKGGLLGTIIGGVAGAVGAAAAPFTGGASIPAAASAGSLLGGSVGSAIDPQKTSNPQSVGLLSTARRDPEVQLATLMDTQKEIAMSSDLDSTQKNEANLMVERAMDQMRRNLEMGRK